MPIQEVVEEVETEEKDVLRLIEHYASAYGVDSEVMSKVIFCESGFNPKIQSQIINSKGEQEQSYGLSQIHIPSHPDVTIEQATDPEFAIEFMARAMSNGDSWMWTCWRNLYA